MAVTSHDSVPDSELAGVGQVISVSDTDSPLGTAGRSQDIVSGLEVGRQICPPNVQLTTGPELAVRAVCHCTT